VGHALVRGPIRFADLEGIALRVLVLGGTGSIGSAVLTELLAAGHDVLALARSENSAALMEACGAKILRGDIRNPAGWVPSIPEIDAVIHAATDFSDEMDVVDRQLLDSLLPMLGAMPRRVRLVYTGGCWLYGQTGERVATETTPFDPLPAFAWSVPTIERVLAAPEVDALIIHPAMVYTHDGGVFSSFVEDARAGGPITIVDGEHVHWPLVHADDLAVLYRLVLERGAAGASYNGAAVAGLPVGSIVRAIARRFGLTAAELRIVSANAAAVEHGEWARGYGLDQRMSGDRPRSELGWLPMRADPLRELAEPG
jgi:nucleoside-diphosphate-sugar epimerase